MNAQEIFERTEKVFRSAVEDSEFEVVIQGLEKVVELDPKHIEGWMFLAETHAILGNTTEALKNFHKISTIDIEQTPWCNIGDCLMQNKQYQDAIDAFDKALQKNANDNNALVGKAIATLKTGETQTAEKIFDEAEAVAMKHNKEAALEVQALRMALMNKTNNDHHAEDHI